MRANLAVLAALWAAALVMCLPAAVAAAAVGLAPVNATEAQPRPSRPLRLCTSERPPMSFCQYNVDSRSLEALGITADLFRAAAAAAGWAEGADYYFDCVAMRGDDFVADLASDDSACDAVIAAIVLTSERSRLGIQFAWPHYNGYVTALVSISGQAPSGWNWIEPFTTSLWLAIIGTMLVWPALIFILEAYALRGRIKPRHVVVGLEESIWRSLWALFFGETIQLATLGAKVAAGCFAFVSLILSSAYTANLVAYLSLRGAGTLGSVEELVGMAVATVSAFSDRLRTDYNLIAVDANITDTASIMRAADLVEQGKLKAFLYNQVVLEWVVSNYPGCKLATVDEVLPFFYAVPFAKGVDPALVDAFSKSVLNLMDTGLMRDLESKYINRASTCFDTTSTDQSSQIDFLSVYGLWVILAAGLGLGAGVMLANRWHRQHRKRRLKAMRSANKSAGRGAARPGIVDLIFTPQLSLRTPKESDLHGPTSDLVEISDDDDDSSSDEDDK